MDDDETHKVFAKVAKWLDVDLQTLKNAIADRIVVFIAFRFRQEIDKILSELVEDFQDPEIKNWVKNELRTQIIFELRCQLKIIP